MENKMISFIWNTGHIDVMLCEVLDLAPAHLKKLVNAATMNGDEVKAEIADYIRPIFEALNRSGIESGNKKEQKSANRLKALLDVVDDRKLSKAEKALQRVIKACENRPQLGGFMDAGYYCVCDGLRLIRYSAVPAGFTVTNGTFEASKAIGDISAYSVKLELPKVADLKKEIKIVKSGKVDFGNLRITKNNGRSIDIGYDFGYGLPMVDANYLVDMLEALPDAVAYCCENRKFNPVYFVSGENDGLLMPVRKSREYEAAPVVTSMDREQVETVEQVENVAPDTDENADTVCNDTTVKDTTEPDTDGAIDTGTDADTATGADTVTESAATMPDAVEIVTVHPAVIAALAMVCTSAGAVASRDCPTGDDAQAPLGPHINPYSGRVAPFRCVLSRPAPSVMLSAPFLRSREYKRIPNTS